MRLTQTIALSAQVSFEVSADEVREAITELCEQAGLADDLYDITINHAIRIRFSPASETYEGILGILDDGLRDDIAQYLDSLEQ